VALQDFEGALVLVSHDRHLLRSVCDEFWLVAEGRAQPFDGDMDDYARWLAEYKARQAAGNGGATGSAPQGPGDASDARQDRKQDRRRAAEIRERTRPLRQKIEALEKALEKQQSRRTAIEASLADTGLYDASRKDELTRLLREQATLTGEIDRLESDWLDAREALDTLTRELEAG
jgi:ATP-binding cassette subfamily F protein 3